MINFFYTIYKKECGKSSYMFFYTFPFFIFFSLFSIIGFLLTLVYYLLILFFNVDYLLIVLINLSITFTYPIVRILQPGYKIKEEVLKYSNFNIRLIYYASFIISFLFWRLYMEVISLIIYH
jgi:hypothetical protein